MTACAACGRDRSLGELLRVTDRAGLRVDAFVCRSSVGGPACLGWAGHAGQTSIALADPEAARAFDRNRGGSAPDRLSREADEARDLNARRAAYG